MVVTTQRSGALARGNEVRLARAELHREIKGLSRLEGEARAVEILADPPEWLLRMEVACLLAWINRWGSPSAERFCVRYGVSPFARIGGSRQVNGADGGRVLSDRQRRVLCDALLARAPR
jgi:hypothetical protein